jgi:uncharacterized protein (TIGR02266 family)
MADTMPLVLPVRFSGGGLSMQTTSSRLSAEGVFIRGVVTPKQGALVSTQLTLPGSPPVEARGTVTERVMPGSQGKEAGFWLRFDNIEGDGRERLEELLRRRAEPGGSAKRAFTRVPAHLKVKWQSAREFLVAYAENISAGGIFVATPDPPPLSSVIDLSMELPDGPEAAKTKAEVIQRISVQEAKEQRKQAGAGLQFVGSDDEFRRRLDLCIENLLARPVT